MDAVFGKNNFRNEIVWCYAGGGIPKNDFPRKHDTILRYTKSKDYFYTPAYRSYSDGTQQRGRTQVKGKYLGIIYFNTQERFQQFFHICASPAMWIRLGKMKKSWG